MGEDAVVILDFVNWRTLRQNNGGRSSGWRTGSPKGERGSCAVMEKFLGGRCERKQREGGSPLRFSPAAVRWLCFAEAVTRWWYIRVGGAVSRRNSKAARGENSSGSEGEMGEGRLKEMEKMN
ncbi:hypothetical protein HAX54_026485 [Datura stramonium]|uniref:Uncharacterized protein n=1 Tax=Datura stramonium TaxID=4076 RepID=A0ABS8V364_DATST|nr:hypothetical protein [Datura stramonium]